MPFHEYYYFKIPLAQGPDAMDWAQEYIVYGLMMAVAGALRGRRRRISAWHRGALAKAISTFNPDESWRESPEEADEN